MAWCSVIEKHKGSFIFYIYFTVNILDTWYICLNGDSFHHNVSQLVLKFPILIPNIIVEIAVLNLKQLHIVNFS
jgi:hypothetical protein